MKKNKIVDPPCSLVDKDFHYNVDVDYDKETHCDEAGCSPNDYCRCSTIENARVTDVNIRSIAESITGTDDSTIVKYGIDRILTKMNVSDPHNWEVNICGGYYGEEIDSVKLSIADDVQKAIDQFRMLDSIDKKVEFLLLLEYGYLTEKVKNCCWDGIMVNKDDICLMDDVMKKVDTKIVQSYKNYPYHKCVVIADGKKYRLVDGYHRFVASNNNEISVLCGYKR